MAPGDDANEAGCHLLAAGFIADAAAEATRFPSVGQDSSTLAFQAIYWRCLAVLFYSARVSNPDLPLALFCNVIPPRIGSLNLERLFSDLGVSCIQLPLAHRLPPSEVKSWGNVFYFLDIAKHLRASENVRQFALIDSDVVVTSRLSALFDRIEQHGLVGYRVDTMPDHDVNGLSPRQMAGIASERSDAAMAAALPHYGGELLGIDIALAVRLLPAMEQLWSDMRERRGAAAGITTEEQFWSILFAAENIPVRDANDLIKRIWTSWRYSTVSAGDERLALWHLPSEKRFGIADLFHWAQRRNFDPSIPAATLRAQAMRFCGVPRKSITKRLHDGVRQVGYKMGAIGG